MNTPGGTIGTAAPRPTWYTRASPIATGHGSGRAPYQPEDPPGPVGALRQYATTHRYANAARAAQRPPRDGKTKRHPWDRLTSPDTLTMGVKPASKGPAISRGNSGQANLRGQSPPQIQTTDNRATHSADACRSDAPARVTLDYPTSAADIKKMQAGLSTNRTAPPNPFLGAHAFHQRLGKGRGPRHGPSIPPHLPRSGPDQGVQPNTRDQRAADEQGNVTPSPARRVMWDHPVSEHIILENVTSKGRVSRDACATRADTHLLRES